MTKDTRDKILTMRLYQDEYTFLENLARSRGFLRKGGTLNISMAARLIYDMGVSALEAGG